MSESQDIPTVRQLAASVRAVVKKEDPDATVRGSTLSFSGLGYGAAGQVQVRMGKLLSPDLFDELVRILDSFRARAGGPSFADKPGSTFSIELSGAVLMRVPFTGCKGNLWTRQLVEELHKPNL